MKIRLYNSLSNKKEDFKSIIENEVMMYVCGPTVWNYVHIGNARPVVVFDVLRRFFEYAGYKVKFVSNLTDVDDKIINQAIKEGKTEKEITEKYSKAFFEVVNSLNAKKPDITPRVTETMDKIIEFIDDLVKKGFAYEIDGDVYFRVSKIKDYGALGNFNTEDLLSGARIEENDKKENPLDFTLWKTTDTGIKWDSPWGKGRPGWHTECVVMIRDNFGVDTIDIHGGGNDLKFPHHENEMAQSKAMSSTCLANYWVHNGMINIDNQKMSKSLGNIRLAKDMIDEYGGNVIRMNLLSTYYRSPVNFSLESLESSAKEVEKLLTSLNKANIKLQLNDYKDNKYDKELVNKYLEHLADDLNIANALSVVFETIKKLNVYLRSNDLENISLLYNTLLEENKILGIKYEPITLTKEDKDIYKEWEMYKKEKNFTKADMLREKLIDKGIL